MLYSPKYPTGATIMKFTKFEIKNYKGIKDVTLNLYPEGSNVFTLIGLNESGKTSILEAISQFNPARDENEISELYSSIAIKTNEDYSSLIPKQLKANFNDEIIISATIEFSQEDRDKIIEYANKYSDEFNIIDIDNEIKIKQTVSFENSTYKKRTTYVNFSFKERKNKRKKEIIHKFFSKEEPIREFHIYIYDYIKSLIPKINYFPTFIFSQPEKIKIFGENQTIQDKIYTTILSNIASSLRNPLDLKTHIIDRAISADENDAETLQSSLDQMSALMTKDIFSLWQKILQGDFNNREITLRHSVDQYKKNVYIQFQIKQGASRYNFMERSLGFRWFFSFLLFTFYNQKKDDKPTLFLLDEPASNLHAKAQEELLKSFQRITDNKNQVIYSTHSHYLINPMWLDQAYIVSNAAMNYEHLDDRSSSENTETSVSLQTYRNYVKDNPTKTTYFQPVLDKLEIRPSKLDCIKKSVLVEGKSDYLILEYAMNVLLESSNEIAILPMGGATKYGSLISILKGWGVPFLILLDADRAGERAAKEYKNSYFLDDEQVLTLSSIIPELQGKEISSLLLESDKQIISEHFGESSTQTEKSKIQLFFSEHLAQKKIVTLSDEFIDNIKKIHDAIVQYFNK